MTDDELRDHRQRYDDALQLASYESGLAAQPYAEAASCTRAGCDHDLHHCRGSMPTSGRLLASKPVHHVQLARESIATGPSQPHSRVAALAIAVAVASFVLGLVWVTYS